MKRVLLGTTALVAAGAFAGIGAAQAQDMMVPMSVGVGGYYTIAAIGLSQDNLDGVRGHTINQNMEMQLRAEGTLDNGVTAGVRVRFTANDYDHSDEQEVYFKAAFGEFHAGAIESAAQQNVVWAPGASVPIGGIKSPWFASIGPMWTNAFINEDALKVVYFSPAFNGISLAASYAPEDSTNSYGINFDGGLSNDSRTGYVDDDNNPTYGDSHHHGEEISIALNYSVDVMGGSLSASVGYDTLSTESLNGMSCIATAMQVCDPSGLRFGASVSVDQVAIGGAVYQHDAPGGDVAKSDVGVSWTEGPIMLGVQYGDNEANDSNIIALNTNYNLGPGIDVGAQIGAGERGPNEFTQVLFGTMFNF